jgi:hypothetical protein
MFGPAPTTAKIRLVKLADKSLGDLARYIDRVLRGANPADLPVQVPTKYEQSSTSTAWGQNQW